MTNPYVYGGTLGDDNTTYIKREADDQLYEALTHGEFCYVLDSRQTGKSSLRVRTMHRLKNHEIKEIKYVYISLHGLSTTETQSKWYAGQLTEIREQLKLNIDISWFNHWWENDPLDNLQKYKFIIENYMLKQLENNIVIFIDEIDSVLNCSFPTDDLFRFLKHCYEQRPHKPEYNRLTFCLLGVASPNKLIKQGLDNPFGIGKAILLKPFPVNINDPQSFRQMQPLIKGLENKFDNYKDIMTLILYWTGGQPFLTQKLCYLMFEESEKENPISVEEVVKTKIIETWEINDSPHTHLQNIQNRILHDQQRAVYLLESYRDIFENKQVFENISEQIDLKLSGLVTKNEENYLEVLNPIYKNIFNLDWVKQQLAGLRPYSAKFNAWLTANEQLKQRYLLYGNELEQALKWAKYKKILNQDNDFLNDSKNFSQRVQDRFPSANNYQAIIKAIFLWTGGLEFLNNLILDIANKFRNPIPEGEETTWFETKLISSLKQNQKFEDTCKEISDRILNDPNIDPFLLLSSYQAILEKEEVEFNDSPEQQKLIDMCLGVKEDGKLRILGKIYRLIFNQKWVEEQLSRLCPYAKKFQDWQDSSCQDESLLLKGEDLQKAVEWIENKDKLSEQLKFIITSVVWEKWQSNDAVNKVKEFLPPLKEKAKTLAHLVRVIQVILDGTKPQLVLLQAVLQWVGEAEDIPTEDEAKWLEGVINNRLINNWQNSNLSEHFRSIEKRLVENSSCEPFWLLVQYRQILLNEKIEFDNGKEQNELLKLGLIVNINQYLKIANDIYKTIFNQEWAYSKLLENQRNHAINLVIWLKGCNQDEPALRELKEWTAKNEGLTKKIVSDRQNPKFNNNLNLNDEIRLLTYDIIKMEVGENQPKSIQHSLNYIFQKDRRNMATAKLDILLNTIVDKASEIGAVVVLGLKQGMVLRSSVGSNLEESSNQALSQIIRSEAFVNFVKLKTIPEILDNFGEKANFENLNYVMFTLKKGVVIAYFTKIKGNPFAICFISTSNVDMPGLFLAQCEGKFEEIEKELAEAI